MGGMCASSCGAGLTDCGGTCRDLQNNRNNCGACGNVCASGSVCCDGTCADLSIDEAHCGNCGSACTAPSNVCIVDTCEAPFPGYTMTSVAVPFINACTDPSILGRQMVLAGTDDSIHQGLFPFDFQFYGRSERRFWISTNSLIDIGDPTSGGQYSNSCLPTGIQSTIAVFWDDLYTANRAGQVVCYGYLGRTPNRRWIATWRDVSFYPGTGDSMTFSAILNESSYIIEYSYGTMSGGRGSGTSATIGIQAAPGGPFVQHSCNSGVISSGTGIRFTPM